MGARGRRLFVMVGRRWARGAVHDGEGGQRYRAPRGLALPLSAVFFCFFFHSAADRLHTLVLETGKIPI